MNIKIEKTSNWFSYPVLSPRFSVSLNFHLLYKGKKQGIMHLHPYFHHLTWRQNYGSPTFVGFSCFYPLFLSLSICSSSSTCFKPPWLLWQKKSCCWNFGGRFMRLFDYCSWLQMQGTWSKSSKHIYNKHISCNALVKCKYNINIFFFPGYNQRWVHS